MRVTQMSTKPAPHTTKATGTPEQHRVPVNNAPYGNGRLSRLLSEFETDDYLLAGIIIVLIAEGCEDYILLAALGYLFVMGLK